MAKIIRLIYKIYENFDAKRKSFEAKQEEILELEEIEKLIKKIK